MKKLNYEQIKKDLVEDVNNVIGVVISPMPYANAEGNKLVYSIDVYRKGDSKFLGKIEIKAEDIITN